MTKAGKREFYRISMLMAVITLSLSIGVIAVIIINNPDIIKFNKEELTKPKVFEVNIRETSYTTMIANVIDSIITEDIDTDIDKCKIIHDFVIDRVEYDYGGTAKNREMKLNQERNDPERALKECKGMCFAYAQLFCDLANEAGLECYCVLGTITDSRGPAGHAWNIVKIDHSYYHIDTCWDDGGLNKSEPNYDWFLIGKTKASNRGSEDQWSLGDWSTYYSDHQLKEIDYVLNNMPLANYKINRDNLKGYKFEYVY